MPPSIPQKAGKFLMALDSAQYSPGPTSGTVLNIVYQVTNDADSGFGGYWR